MSLILQKVLYRILAVAIILSTLSLYISSNKLAYGNTFEPHFFSIVICTVICLILSILSLVIFHKFPLQLKVRWLDIILISSIGYSIIRSEFTSSFPYVNIQCVLLLGYLTLYFGANISFNKNDGFFKHLFIIFIMVSALFQATIGQLQLIGELPSTNPLFRITGTFSNPTPLGLFLTCAFPFALAYAFEKPQKKANYFIRIVSILTLVGIFLIVPASMVRTSWIAIILMTVVFLAFRNKERILLIPKSRWIGVAVGVILISALLAVSLFKLKEQSSSGRIFIWGIAIKAASEKPIFGNGYHSFKAKYNHFQSQYFASGNRSHDDINRSDYIETAYNEYIETFFETGLVGVILLFGSLTMCIWFLHRHLRNSNDPFFISIYLLLVGLSLCCLSSYPLHLPVILTILFISLGSCRNLMPICFVINKSKRKLMPQMLKVLGAFCCLLFALIFFKTWQTREGYIYWKKGNSASEIQSFSVAQENFSRAYPLLNHDPNFVRSYAKNLLNLKKQKETVNILEEQKDVDSDPVLYLILAQAYQEMGEFKNAEHNYQVAHNIVPNRFYPKYLMALMYEEQGDHGKAAKIANEVLKMEVKVSSTAVVSMINQMKSLVE